MSKVYLINAKRTAIGKFLGSFYGNSAVEASSALIRELLRDVNAADVD